MIHGVLRVEILSPLVKFCMIVDQILMKPRASGYLHDKSNYR